MDKQKILEGLIKIGKMVESFLKDLLNDPMYQLDSLHRKHVEELYIEFLKIQINALTSPEISEEMINRIICTKHLIETFGTLRFTRDSNVGMTKLEETLSSYPEFLDKKD